MEGLDRNMLGVCPWCLLMCVNKKVGDSQKMNIHNSLPHFYYFSPSSSIAIESVFAKLNIVSSCFRLFVLLLTCHNYQICETGAGSI